MEKKEIKEEILSKMEINLKDTLFYMPGEIIKGEVTIYPGFKLNMKSKKIHLTMKILQYEFWEYTNIKVDELKNVYKTEIQTNYYEYSLKKEDQSKYNETINIENFSIIFIDKDEKKEISIPFELKLIDDDNKLLPTFQFENEQYILGIRHLLIVECEEYNSKNYIGLFIGKNQNNNYIEKSEINNSYLYGLSIININVIFPKRSFSFDEEIKYNITNNLKYVFKLVHDCKFEHNLFRKIEWVGYLKNTLLDKKLLKQIEQEHENVKGNTVHDDEHESQEEAWSSVFVGILGGIVGGIHTINTAGLLLAPIGGLASLIAGTIGGFFLYNLEPGNASYDSNSSFKGINEKVYNKQNENEIKEFMTKFVYFQGDKIIGFIKFKEDITPPVNGYYFKCKYYIKINVKMEEDFSINQKKEIKSDIDFYDGKEYILKMKKIFSIN